MVPSPSTVESPPILYHSEVARLVDPDVYLE